MDKLTAMKTFVRIVEAGSLTAAAETLDTSLPTVVRTLAGLERDPEPRLAVGESAPRLDLLANRLSE